MIVHLHDRGKEALKELMQDAEILATNAMRNFGELNAALLIHGANGNSIYMPSAFSDIRAKETFAENARLMCIEQAADAVVFVTEAWTRFAKHGEKLDLSKAPSECADRKEVVFMIGESIGDGAQRLLPIVRSVDGKFTGFDHSAEVMHDRIEGRFAHLLPKTFPTPEERRHARLQLELRGIHKGKDEEKGRGYGRAMM